MRATPIPLLRDLPPGWWIIRCVACRELVLADEACGDDDEARQCLPRLALEHSVIIGDERSLPA